MKKILGILVLGLLLNTSAYTDDIKDFQIEEISIGDSALDYFSEAQLEDNELDWHNYSYKEYSTSLLPGKGIYDWLHVSYKSDDDNFTIESYLNILGLCRRKLLRNCYETLNKQKLSLCFLVEFNYYGYKHSLTERWLSG